MLLEVIGIIGGLCAFTSYMTVALKRVTAWTHVIAAASCLLIGYYTFEKQAWPNVGLSVIWFIAALFALLNKPTVGAELTPSV